MEMQRETFRDRLRSNVRRYDFFLYAMFVFEILLLLVGLLSYAFADLDAETRSILLLDFALLGLLVPVTGGLICLCHGE